MGVKHSKNEVHERRLNLLGREVSFTINGVPYQVFKNVPANTTLNWFIREQACLKGTKFMCLEGGCGACIVNAEFVHPKTNKRVSYAVNSCMVPIYVCHGWDITTVEGLGSSSKGYNKVQSRLAAANGTQCGYCSPGMVMNMFSLLEKNPNITMKEVENSFGGNICRCTGYRPILDGFKSLASDAPNELVQKIKDIEDSICPKTNRTCQESCSGCEKPSILVSPQPLMIKFDNGADWFRPTTKQEVFEILDMIGDKSYRMIAGNTSQGVYRSQEDPNVYIDLNGIDDLHGHGKPSTDGLRLGANINLTETMELFYSVAKEYPTKFEYLRILADHIDVVANVPIRNIGTIAGNLMIKHAHRAFPSDIFLILEMVGSKLFIEDISGSEMEVPLLEFLDMNMDKKLITSIRLPALDNCEYFTSTFKICPRAQNAHAYVNAAFLIRADPNKKFRILEKPTLLFGGIRPDFLHATKAEELLNGRELLDDKTLETVLNCIELELNPDHELPDASPGFRKGLALSLFYKFVLKLGGSSIDSFYKSGGTALQRPLSSGKQDYETNRDLWPLNKPTPKIEALMQCAGEAEYVNDIPEFPKQLWGQLVLCDRAATVINSIDASEALRIPGVVAFLTAKDIPGVNNYMPRSFIVVGPEPVFVEGKTNYAGEAVGVILAENNDLAIKAAKKVRISYGKSDKLFINTRDVLNENVTDRIIQKAQFPATEKKTNVKYELRGKWDTPSQYHYTMEPLTCVAVPVEDCIDLYPASQWPHWVQEVASQVLGIPQNKFNVKVRRIGGGYGAKVSKPNHSGAVCALAAHILQRPVRMVLQLEVNTEWAGKRSPYCCNYEAGVDENGKIQFLDAKIYQGDGFIGNESAVEFALHHFVNAYDASTWTRTGYGVKTDIASTTWCRAPATTEATMMIEAIMEHIARVVKKDPNEVRLANMDTKDNPIPQLMEEIKKSSNYDNRKSEIEQFNKENRWKKRGISLLPMTYPFPYFGTFFATVSIYGQDGSVAISHGGIEMGQGIHTKAAQVAAATLGIDLKLVSVKPTDVFQSPNNFSTGGSLGSESVSYAVKKCCEEINSRLQPIKNKLGPNAEWKQIINQAYDEAIELHHSHMFSSEKDGVQPYNIYGVAVAEVEVDILTGQYLITRVDILEDAGQSMSPDIDIGQIEGAFIMGVGLFTCEEVIYESDSGKLLTNRTWNYKVPGAKDIPADFRVTMLKNAPNPFGILKSKATGEPPFCLSSSVVFALRNAIESARQDSEKTDDLWFNLELPLTVERLWLGSLNKKSQYKLQMND